MRVHIALPVLSSGDAIGHDVLGMGSAVRKQGSSAVLYAEKSLIAEDVLPLEALRDSSNNGLLIYHHSHGCEAAMSMLRSWPGRVVVKYHNVTPPRFFPAGEVRDAAELGLQQARELANAFPVWVDSAFNAEELGHQFEELPPFMPTETLKQMEPDASVASQLDDWTTTLLCVGRVAPNKNLLLAIDALAAYRERFHDNTRLIIAGGHVFPEYSEAVRDRIESKNLQECVTITGRVTPEQLKGLYLATDVLLVTSEHEGFCVPLVEAMALRVPTVAVENTAIPGTAGPFAKYSNADANDLAAAIHDLVDNGSQRESHLKSGTERYRERYHPSVIEGRFNELLSSLSSE